MKLCFFLCFLFLGISESASLGEIELSDIEEDIVVEIQKHLQTQEYSNWAADLNWLKLEAFYKKRNFLPLWLNTVKPSIRALEVRDVLVRADLEGLDPNEYHAPAIQAMWNSKKPRIRADLACF